MTRRAEVAAKLHGVVVRGVGVNEKPVLELCPGERFAPCPGVELVGNVPAQFISTEARVVPMTAYGKYSGATLQVEKIEGRTLRDEESPERYRNPCPEYQTPLGGPENGPETLQAEMERLERDYEARISAVWWDRPRQTLTVRMTGDVSEVKKSLKLKQGERLCLVGGAAVAQAEIVEKIEGLYALLSRGEAMFLSSSYNSVSGRAQVELEALDAATRKIIEDQVGSEAEIDAFIEVLDAHLQEVPLPPRRGAFPLVTNPARSSSAMMMALGRFSLHADRAQRCVYLKAGPGEGTRLQPLLPFGYAVLDEPLRLVDFDGRVVAREGELTDWAGGHVGAPSATDGAATCGAESAWSGAPTRRSK